MTTIESIVDRQLRRWETEVSESGDCCAEPSPMARMVTISSQSGSRGSYFGSRLAQRLGYQRFRREAVDLIGRSDEYLQRICAALDSAAIERVDQQLAALVPRLPSDQADYAGNICRAILAMAELGGVVLMGRGANFVCGLQQGFHLRVVCPRASRIQNLVKYTQYSKEEVAEQIDRSEAERRSFVTDLFDADVDDPHQYDMVVNTALIDIEDMVDITMAAIKAKTAKITYLDHDQM